jgi:pimeloyl-ACP methyl ester carboxylesterase
MTMAIIQHHTIVTDEEVTLRYVTAGAGPTLVLQHGFPQNWTAWGPVIDRISNEYRVIAPMLRGLGGTRGPVDGYDTSSLAGDLRAILAVEGDDEPVVLCGHDIGSHVVFAYALRYRSSVRALVMVGPPPPGTQAMDNLMTNPRTWHINFHMNVDVAHMLISGRERQYIDYFIRSRINDNAAISDDEVDLYAGLYAAPGALRSALEMYRALPVDRELNIAELARNGRLEVPVVAVGSGMTSSYASLASVLDEIAEDGTAVYVDSSGHWIPQERPDVLADIFKRLTK